MTLRSSLIVFSFGTLCAWISFGLILFTVSPSASGNIGEIFFFSSLGIALIGTCTVLGILGRSRHTALLPSHHVSAAFRQAILLTCAVVGALLLNRFHMFRWWTVLFLGSVLFLFDVLLHTRTRDRRDMPQPPSSVRY